MVQGNKISFMPAGINNILIANRGEIAVRIIRTLKESGIGSVGIFSDADRNSPWIRQCDRSWSLGSGVLAETYLDISKIIRAALETGADAIHPGYGFLSENYRLAEACEQNNLIFIGPSSRILKIAGDKQIAHDIVKNLGIPVMEKITGNPHELLSKASGVDYPLLAKAVAGGGGKGIRKVRKPGDLGGVLRTVSAEALKSFGDDRVYLEKFIENPRHIEVQILGDMHGNRVHLFERECSVQRRHQKLIEESPAANISNELRRSLSDAALKIANYLEFVSAGTIEFLVDRNGNYLFLEINPRIQVEHGVTEMITGIDLVREQINIAKGRKLSFTQDRIVCSGHATQVRIYSEDPENQMIPLPGTIQYLSFPTGSQIRIDTGAEAGNEIHTEFDPLIAKILTWGSNRVESVERMKLVLQKTEIYGLVHNLPLFGTILEHEDYLSGSISTTWLEDIYPSLVTRLTDIRQRTVRVFPVLAAAIYIITKKSANSDSWTGSYWRNINQIRLRASEELIEMDYEKQVNGITFYIGNDIFHISNLYRNEYRIEFRVNEEFNKCFMVTEQAGNFSISDGHFMHTVGNYSPGSREFKYSIENEEKDDNMVMAPQPGTVVDIRVCEGQSVNRGDYLLTIESMKLENTIMAATGGVVRKIHIKAGDKVRKNEPLMHLQQVETN